jgi:L-seryl-tRNA(Ser) seleniumtransferase
MEYSLESLGIAPIINAAGSVTHLSASPITAEVAHAMAAAAQSSVDIADVQGRASEIIALYTGAEAGIVTSGASAGLLLGAAACLAGLDAGAMDKLPETTGMRNEFIIPRSHRNSYDHAVRAAGGRFVEAGVADRIVGVGIRDTEGWELEGALTDRTAGFFYVARIRAPPCPRSPPSPAATACRCWSMRPQSCHRQEICGVLSTRAPIWWCSAAARLSAAPWPPASSADAGL